MLRPLLDRDEGAREISIVAHDAILPPPPRLDADGAGLFLDFDGTLVDLIDDPDQVTADAELRALLAALDRRLDGRVAVISGRSLAQLDGMLGPVAATLLLSGSHGGELRWEGRDEQPPRPPALDAVAVRLHDLAGAHDGAIVETKTLGVALHYRRCPEIADNALALARRMASEHELYLQEGKMMVELRPAGHDKGKAITRMMTRAPMAGTRPVFVGDDVTDETAFVAAEAAGGYGVLVGAVRETAASYRLSNPAAVRDWLTDQAR